MSDNNIKTLFVFTRNTSLDGLIVNYHPLGKKQSSVRRLTVISPTKH